MARSTPSPNWNKEFRALRSAGDLVALVGGLVVRNNMNDYPIVVATHAVGPPRLVKHLRQIDGTNLRDLGLGKGGWRLNAGVDVTDTHHPLTAAAHLLQSSRVRSVHVLTTAFQGLFTGWFGALYKRRAHADPINQTSPSLQLLAKNGHRQPAHIDPAVLLIAGQDVRTTCDSGKTWLAASGFGSALQKASRTPNRPAWICGARVTFTGVEQQLVASVVPCRRADVLAVARLTRRERTLVQMVATGASHAVIAAKLNCSTSDVRDELERLEHNRVPGGIPGLLRLVEEGWYSASSL